MAALLLAANDRASAYVQWLQLPEAERQAGVHLNAALVELLEKTATRNNENYQLAARLAARLGLQRVYAVDNHQRLGAKSPQNLGPGGPSHLRSPASYHSTI